MGIDYITPETNVRNIFCDECKHYQASTIHNSHVIKDGCFEPTIFNRERYEPGTPITKGFIKRWTFPGKCFKLNKHNDCKLFEKMEWPDRSCG